MAGFRALLPLGLSKPPVVVNIGFRSLFAFWAGGAGVSTTGVEPLPPTPVPSGGGPDHFPPRINRRQVAARIIEGYMFVQEAADGFYATGDVYESEKQVRARRNARALRILLLSS